MESKEASSSKPLVKKLQPGLHYSITGHENQTLQLILERNKQISVDSSTIVWLSDKIQIKSKLSYISRLLQPLHQILELSNESNDPAVVGFGQSAQHGPICIIKSENTPSSSKFYCNRNNFLCSTQSVTITSKSVTIRQPQHQLTSMFMAGNNFYHCQFAQNDINGAIFLQSAGVILEKRMEYGDSLYINLSNIVAFQENINITATGAGLGGFGQGLSPYSSLSSSLVKVEGAGLIYYSSFNDLMMLPGSLPRKADPSSVAILYLLIVITSLCIFTAMVSKLVVEIEIPDNNNLQQ